MSHNDSRNNSDHDYVRAQDLEATPRKGNLSPRNNDDSRDGEAVVSKTATGKEPAAAEPSSPWNAVVNDEDGGVRRLHPDYLQNLGDAVVLGLPWATEAEKATAQSALRARSLAHKLRERCHAVALLMLALSVVALYVVWLDGQWHGPLDTPVVGSLLALNLGSWMLCGWAWFQCHQADGRVQDCVRELLQAMPPPDERAGDENELWPRIRPRLQQKASRQYSFRLPEFVSVWQRCSRNGDGDLEVSALTFRDSWCRQESWALRSSNTSSRSNQHGLPDGQQQQQQEQPSSSLSLGKIWGCD